MRLAVCHGAGSNFNLLREGGLRRPYKVVTMDELWWEAAAEYELPRFFFTDKLRLMRFCLGHELVGVIVKNDGNPETWSMRASLEAMGAVILPIYGDNEED